MARTTRPISWISAARKEFADFPEGAQSICLAALTVAAEGGKADIEGPGLGGDGDRPTLPRQRVPGGLCGADRPRLMGGACVSEEIDPRH